MALELHIAGPNLELTQLLQIGQPELVLGRDTDCTISLPDPDRAVSRRHLAIWNEQDQLHFRVLSLVNGIDMPFGYAPPGAKGVLPLGQVMRVGDYSLQVRASAPQAAEQDPWAVFERGENNADATLPRGVPVSGYTHDLTTPAILPEEDPFGDWGFESTFSPGAGSLPAPVGPGTGDLLAFYKGLGLDPASLGAQSPAELEGAGQAIRIALVGLFELLAARSGHPDGKPASDDAMAPVRDNNPLKTCWPDEAKLQFLFGGKAASVGFLSPQRALNDLVSELLNHDASAAAAMRATLEGTLEEFAPAALKDRLLGAGSKLFEGARAWEAYTRFYADKGQELDGWIEQLLDRYYEQAYLRESQRIKRETGLGSV